jgi:hypothetical protein
VYERGLFLLPGFLSNGSHPHSLFDGSLVAFATFSNCLPDNHSIEQIKSQARLGISQVDANFQGPHGTPVYDRHPWCNVTKGVVYLGEFIFPNANADCVSVRRLLLFGSFSTEYFLEKIAANIRDGVSKPVKVYDMPLECLFTERWGCYGKMETLSFLVSNFF